MQTSLDGWPMSPSSYYKRNERIESTETSLRVYIYLSSMATQRVQLSQLDAQLETSKADLLKLSFLTLFQMPVRFLCCLSFAFFATVFSGKFMLHCTSNLMRYLNDTFIELLKEYCVVSSSS